MMPHAPSAIAPPPVLRQNWETLAQLASWWSKPPDVDMCSHTVFIRSSVLRHKLTNHLTRGFEAQTKKPPWWFCGPNHQTVAADFGAQTGIPTDLGFEAQPRNTCSLSPYAQNRLHTMSRDLPIVQPLSTRPMLDHPQSLALGLILLPRFSLLPHDSPHEHIIG
jgi:hypothetical protein